MSCRLAAIVLAVSAAFLAGGPPGTRLAAQDRGVVDRRPPPGVRAREARAEREDGQTGRSPFRLSAERAVAFARASSGRMNWVPGEVLVAFKPGVSTAQAARALSALREPVSPRAGRWVGEALLVPTPGEDNPELAAGILAQQPEVLWAQPNYIRRLHAPATDPGYGSQWNFTLIDAPGAWDISPGGTSDVLVAVVDTGVTEVSRSLAFRLWTGQRLENVLIPYAPNPDIAQSRIVQGRDFGLFDSGSPVLDMDGHGTHVASTILQSTNNGLGYAGIAYNARLLPVKVCLSEWDLQMILSSAGMPGYYEGDGACSDDAVLAGVRWAADQGAKVVNLSLGGVGALPAYVSALRYAVAKGAFVAISAGNNYEDGNEAEAPAMYGRQIDGVMTVGAVGRSKTRAYYSNTASGVEIAAPGGNTRDGGRAGMIFQYGLNPDDSDFGRVSKPRFDRYTGIGLEGTSMATPHVAGVAALLYSRGVRSPGAIEAIIKRHAQDLGQAGVDDEYGAGLIDARAALRGLGVAR
ncbi:MAG TPA: S8 family serine peptidase [Vicinamibacterales bacterium]|nr:S8 family serine peptidase [Vicinamibacterales bacterium]HPW20969.1 S8 family serine peptidase [Vicinamibacterales bacterium]